MVNFAIFYPSFQQGAVRTLHSFLDAAIPRKDPGSVSDDHPFPGIESIPRALSSLEHGFPFLEINRPGSGAPSLLGLSVLADFSGEKISHFTRQSLGQEDRNSCLSSFFLAGLKRQPFVIQTEFVRDPKVAQILCHPRILEMPANGKSAKTDVHPGPP